MGLGRSPYNRFFGAEFPLIFFLVFLMEIYMRSSATTDFLFRVVVSYCFVLQTQHECVAGIPRLLSHFVRTWYRGRGKNWNSFQLTQEKSFRTSNRRHLYTNSLRFQTGKPDLNASSILVCCIRYNDATWFIVWNDHDQKQPTEILFQTKKLAFVFQVFI
jgi:hypothetical protein